MSEVVEYEVSEVRVEEDNVLLVLTREGDGFGVSIPYSQYQNMSESELNAFLEEQVRNRIKTLRLIELQKKIDEEKKKSIEKIKGHKIRVKKEKEVIASGDSRTS